MFIRDLRIGTDELRFVAGNKDRIESLSFSVLVKLGRINSLITNATQRKLKSLFGVGADKLKKLISDGKKYDFLRKEGDNLIANKLYKNKKKSILLKKKWFNDSKKKGKLTLSAVRKMIEEAIIYNQVRMKEDCVDTNFRASNGQSVKEIRSARRRERSMLRNGSFNKDMVGLSNIRIQQLIGRKRHSALKVVKNAISHGLLTKKWRVEWDYLPGDPCNEQTRKVYEDTNIIICVGSRTSFRRCSNVYQTQKNKYVNHAA